MAMENADWWQLRLGGTALEQCGAEPVLLIGGPSRKGLASRIPGGNGRKKLSWGGSWVDGDLLKELRRQAMQAWQLRIRFSFVRSPLPSCPNFPPAAIHTATRLALAAAIADRRVLSRHSTV